MSILTVDRVTVRFGGLTAVDDVSFAVPRGEIVSVIGPNGAGKTTLFNVVTGVYEPTSGSVLIDGRPARRPWSPAVFAKALAVGLASAALLFITVHLEYLWQVSIIDHYVYRQPFPWGAALRSFLGAWGSPETSSAAPAAGFLLGVFAYATLWNRARGIPEVMVGAGCARTFQNIRLFPKMSVIENVMIGMHAMAGTSLAEDALALPRSRRSHRAALVRAREILEIVGLSEEENFAATKLSYGHQRRLEIARALATDPKLLLLDEPAAGMNPSESAGLIELIRRLRDTGITVLLIEHHMNVVMGISDRIVVLDYGEKIAEGTPAEVRKNPKVIEAYLGTGTSA